MKKNIVIVTKTLVETVQVTKPRQENIKKLRYYFNESKNRPNTK